MLSKREDKITENTGIPYGILKGFTAMGVTGTPKRRQDQVPYPDRQ